MKKLTRVSGTAIIFSLLRRLFDLLDSRLRGNDNRRGEVDMSYQTEYEHSMKDPQGFWRKQAEKLEWFKFPQQILTLATDGIGHWFADGEMNTAYMALDHHVKNGRGKQLALIIG